MAGCLALLLGVGTACTAHQSPAAAPDSSAPARPGSTAATSPSTSPARSSAGPVRNLVATDRFRRRLLAAGAALNDLPATDYTGLSRGLTYYAYDPATHTYWAGAALDAKPTATRALIAGQDAGSYLLFWRRQGDPWRAGTDGGPIGTACALPPAVGRVWGWGTHGCRPPGPGRG